MKLATFSHAGVTRVGIVDGDVVFDVGGHNGFPASMREILADWDAMQPRLTAVSEQAPHLPLAEVRLHAPIPNPSKFLAIGLNYEDHLHEIGANRPQYPAFFTKQVSCINPPYAPIHKPRISDDLDYEGELGFVIGRRCRHVPSAHAADVIAGYLIVNDVSVRDWQRRSATTTLGKSFDTHGPIGPWLVTSDEIGDPHKLALKTEVNGGQRQLTNTNQLIFDCYVALEYLSTVCTLEPGDIVSTGTTSGVGHAMKPPGFLRVGDKVRVTIENIGHIENEVIEEPASTVKY